MTEVARQFDFIEPLNGSQEFRAVGVGLHGYLLIYDGRRTQR